MKEELPEPNTSAPLPTLPTIRHDGWTGEKMAVFCESLAETAVVAEACDAAHMGISGAYAARRRNPVFAAAWDAALSIARERLADTLLARSMEGNIEQIYKDGELVGERHVLDNRLGLAILRRLDRLAETGRSLHSTPLPMRKAAAPAIVAAERSFDWESMVGALHAGDDEGVAKALALLNESAFSLSKGHEVEEVEDPPIRHPHDDSADVEYVDHWDRCWKDGIDDIWLTNFPPPPGFVGYQQCEWGDPDETYERACTPEEVAILEAHAAAERAVERAREDVLRDEWFALLKREERDGGEVERETATTTAESPAD